MNIELTKENLEYITFVARKYCNLYDECYADLAVATALYQFKQRITQIEDSEKYELYTNTEKLQESITKYNFDSNKFWLLVLFLKDFTDSCFGSTLVFNQISVGEEMEKMMKMLDSPHDCKITISNGKEAATINAVWLESLMFKKTIEEMKSIYPLKKVDSNNQSFHKIKFFMKMLDYFLMNYNTTYSHTNKGIKDWGFSAKVLYIADLLNDPKFYTGTKIWVDDVKNKEYETTVPVGKLLKNWTKNLKNTADRHKSAYCYIPELDF